MKKVSKAVRKRQIQEALARYGEWDGHSYWIVDAACTTHDPIQHCDCREGKGGKYPDKCICGFDRFLVKANSEEHAIDTIMVRHRQYQKYDFSVVAKAATLELIVSHLEFKGGVYNFTDCFG